jgi:hypothetical protein
MFARCLAPQTLHSISHVLGSINLITFGVAFFTTTSGPVNDCALVSCSTDFKATRREAELRKAPHVICVEPVKPFPRRHFASPTAAVTSAIDIPVVALARAITDFANVIRQRIESRLAILFVTFRYSAYTVLEQPFTQFLGFLLMDKVTETFRTQFHVLLRKEI